MEGGALRQMLAGALVAPADAGRARAEYVVRAHLLERVCAALEKAQASALLVKGAALALSVYPEPWSRRMRDVDLVARPGDFARTVRALARAGLARAPEADRPLTADAFGEQAVVVRDRGLALAVEVHAGLDKLRERPVDWDAVFVRARPAPGLPALLLPAPEDHALLVALHLAGHDFDHAIGLVDLDRLLRAGLDRAALLRRAREWRLETALHLALRTLAQAGGSPVAADLARALRPGLARRAAVSLFYRPGAWPVARGTPRLGLPWVLRQTTLRDDLLSWTAGIARYAALRAIERARLGR